MKNFVKPNFNGPLLLTFFVISTYDQLVSVFCLLVDFLIFPPLSIPRKCQFFSTARLLLAMSRTRRKLSERGLPQKRIVREQNLGRATLRTGTCVQVRNLAGLEGPRETRISLLKPSLSLHLDDWV